MRLVVIQTKGHQNPDRQELKSQACTFEFKITSIYLLLTSLKGNKTTQQPKINSLPLNEWDLEMHVCEDVNLRFHCL